MLVREVRSLHGGTVNCRYTIDELATLVGMSKRNIRAHQSRGLLRAPVRDGRMCYYDDSHVQRLRRIISLQNEGFNLASITAVLGGAAGGRDLSSVTQALKEIAGENLAVISSLNRHQLVDHRSSGELMISQTAVLDAVLGLAKAGYAPTEALRLLGLTADVVDECVKNVLESPYAHKALSDGADARRTPGLAQGLSELLANTFRYLLERRVQAKVCVDSEWVEDVIVFENG
ncbi:MerR family transcriptional regulator [Lentzea sp. NPDC006480]|uniref:MerR family transcriptional regulator n=1 Tax=Lentzea sp. NPDC006480 TaxID=3157176 RepID=UPI0033BC3423